MGEITGVLEAVRNAGDGDDVTLSDILDTAGEHSLTAVLLVPALIVVTPLSGIPGFSSILGLAIALISAQILLGRRHLWMPAWITRRSLTRERLQRGVDWLGKPARFIDTITGQRLTLLVHRPVASILHLACLLCGLAMPFLEFVPFSSSVLGAAVSLIAIALLARDGLFALVAVLLVGGAGSLPFLLATQAG
ncbi:exopolysaccharide biosynthesis protein [Pseudohoeflea suaedae]|uniref:Exopolysaccharide biosynthesis protein n=1 Tax=Pseudohoeflea suaedae TaxID=877384 RepID=A0A4R5PKS4_9HYPH|nr:exopolysaccharide biosynthesis protein [Pseudohoeflea suaedae]TDH35834.1 exopolysaccharide biosynthesis protein [Pseudohoeflea suaedae]